jgi:hypothetical protein
MFNSICAQDLAYHIKSKEYEGYVFYAEYYTLLFSQNNRFTPNKDEIVDAELLIKSQIKHLNSNKTNQVKGCPIIHKRLKKYKRQYIGYIDESGDKIIWVNCIWYKELSDNWYKELQIVLDGCSYFWNIKINLTTKEVFELNVNGIA